MNHTENSDMNLLEKYQWLKDARYQAVLKSTHTVAFEFNPTTQAQYITPFINDFIAGNYDGRLLSDVMLEDNILHPEDISECLDFRKQVYTGHAEEIRLRLLTPAKEYHWFKMCLLPYSDGVPQSYIGTITDIDEEYRSIETLRYRTEYDVVTGIYNKPTFYATSHQWMKQEPDVFRCLVRFDIDRFKIINEIYSLSEGDRVLSCVGSLLKDFTTSDETYARISSDIYCMCLARSKEETVMLLEEIEQRLNKYPIDFQFILSAGIVCIPHYNGEPINVLCDWAAMAQRTVKGSYINHYAFYENAMSEALNKEHYFVKNMNNALQEHQFTIYFQPKYDMRTHRIIGAEALVRWLHPKDGIIPPGDFIPLFERNGFIVRLDEYVWELTCQTLRRWLDTGMIPVPVSVNVSRVHLYDTAFCSKFKSLIEKYKLPASLLELEITESAYTDNPNILYGIMDKLQEMGFSFSMDDFGSGYSSLNVLKDIPVNVIKIDMNFLKQARRGADFGRDVLKGTVQLINGINLPIIAEGVETAEQAEFLLDIGCVLAQGYFYAKPMPIPDFELLLLEEYELRKGD